jgi:hypothetical protein
MSAYLRKKARIATCRFYRSAVAPGVFSKRKARSPRKLEPHEVIARLKGRKAQQATS